MPPELRGRALAGPALAWRRELAVEAAVKARAWRKLRRWPNRRAGAGRFAPSTTSIRWRAAFGDPRAGRASESAAKSQG